MCLPLMRAVWEGKNRHESSLCWFSECPGPVAAKQAQIMSPPPPCWQLEWGVRADMVCLVFSKCGALIRNKHLHFVFVCPGNCCCCLTTLVLYNCYPSYPNLNSVDKYHCSFKKNRGNISLYAALMLDFMKFTSQVIGSVLKGSKTSLFSFRQPQQELYREWLVHRLSRLHHHLHEHLRDPRDNQKGKFDVCGVFTFVRLWVIWSTTVIGVMLLVNKSFNPFPAWTFFAGEFIQFSHPLSVQSQLMSFSSN